MIKLSHGGEFDENDLVDHIRASGREYIIQGQQFVSRNGHSKPQSLDYWLRQFGRNKDTKQADGSVMDALEATGLFEKANGLTCPDTGNLCNGLRLL